ncbi:MAG: hypothetical protein IK096_04800 [Lachnospiraceae bacterium]|nr:hypothetical protein [Lachnospiraceae bacterium]
MTIEAYMNPDFTWPKKLYFFAVALVGVLLCNLILYGFSRIIGDGKDPGSGKNARFKSLLFRFYELVISATSVMSFACAYVVLNHVYSLYRGRAGDEIMAQFLYIWENWKDFALLLLICLSCFANTILDKIFIPLKGITREQIAVIRMLGMFYAIIVLLYLNVIGDASEYGPVMMYYLGLMVGRFVYFDASFRDFLKAMKNMFLCLPMLIMGLTLSGLISYLGFQAGFLLERNYYIVGVFYTHLFLLAAVFVIHLVQRIFSRK